ncbi:hypothetical protein L6452_01787 [Arctium lappa]|uniref:Uncharacterized protein n=1 Tax=Arctium lappa TaxID=4217 RepID=A0ACB9FI23_ARCLA|nr:hypothetical protein L6452_01787 [Arctium lappa]
MLFAGSGNNSRIENTTQRTNRDLRESIQPHYRFLSLFLQPSLTGVSYLRWRKHWLQTAAASLNSKLGGYTNGGRQQDPTQAIASGIFQINTVVSSQYPWHKTSLHIGQLVKDTSDKLKQASKADHHAQVSLKERDGLHFFCSSSCSSIKLCSPELYLHFVSLIFSQHGYEMQEWWTVDDLSSTCTLQEVLLLDNEIVFNEAIIEGIGRRVKGKPDIKDFLSDTLLGESKKVFLFLNSTLTTATAFPHAMPSPSPVSQSHSRNQDALFIHAVYRTPLATSSFASILPTSPWEASEPVCRDRMTYNFDHCACTCNHSNYFIFNAKTSVSRASIFSLSVIEVVF